MTVQTMVSSDDRLPDFLTIPEAAALFRIGRSSAYELAREYLATDGATGIPVIPIGRQLRVPLALLENRIGYPVRENGLGRKPKTSGEQGRGHTTTTFSTRRNAGTQQLRIVALDK